VSNGSYEEGFLDGWQCGYQEHMNEVKQYTEKMLRLRSMLEKKLEEAKA